MAKIIIKTYVSSEFERTTLIETTSASGMGFWEKNLKNERLPINENHFYAKLHDMNLFSRDVTITEKTTRFADFDGSGARVISNGCQNECCK